MGRTRQTAPVICLLLALAAAGCGPTSQPMTQTAAPPYAVLGAPRAGRLLLGDAHAVYLLDGEGTPARLLAQAEPDKPLRMELAPFGERFGIYRSSSFVIYDAAGQQVAQLPPPGAGARHKLLGTGDRVLSPVVQGRGMHGARIVGFSLRDLSDRELARLPVADPLFTRPARDHVAVATADALLSFGWDGALRYRVDIAAHDVAVAQVGQALLAVDAHDRRRAVYLRDGREIARVELREPIWNVALSPTGQHAAVTTRKRLHMLEHGVLQRSIALPAQYALTLDVDDAGHVLVGAQDAEHRGQVLCYGPDGGLRVQRALGIDDHAYRPRVRFEPDGDRFAAIGGDQVYRGECGP